MTSNNAPVGDPGRTPEDVVAGLEAVRAECLRTMTGDVLATWADVPADPDPLLAMTGSVRVEFHTGTLAPLMADAVDLIRRLEERAAEGSEILRRTLDRVRTSREESTDGAVSASQGLGGRLAPVNPCASVTDPSVGSDGDRVGDVWEDRYGRTLTVTEFRGGNRDTPAHAVVSHEDDCTVYLETAHRQYGPLTRIMRGPVPGWVRRVGARCTDRDGDMWTVSRVSNVHGPALLSDSGYLNGTVTDVARRWGPLVWEDGRVTDGDTTDTDNDAGRDH